MLLFFNGSHGNALTLEVAVLVVALLWDALFGEPRRLHPVKGIGKLISLAEHFAPRRGRTLPFIYGLGMAILLPGVTGAAVYFLIIPLREIAPLLYVFAGAYILKSCFSVRELRMTALRVWNHLKASRWNHAREELKSLVSRDTAGLTPALMASAAVESVAENTTDGFLAPWLAFALLGLPGAVAYRVLNTMDSMIGYHGRYEYLGKAAARLDDFVNFIPARLAGFTIVISACIRRQSARPALQTMMGQHRRTESPNAGWTMSAMAGALGVRLEKPGHYLLGNSRPPAADDIREALRIMLFVALIGFVLTLGILVIRYSSGG